MPEIGFQDHQSGFRIRRDFSPDSVIFTIDSNNFSVLSSASPSVNDRSSFASDLHDHDESPFSDVVSPHLAGHEHSESSSGPDLDPNKAVVHKNSHIIQKEKVKVRKHDNKVDEIEDENLSLDSARSSFSLALKECQQRRARSEAMSKKADRRRPLSLDFNNSIINETYASPLFGVTKKNSLTNRGMGMFPSPRTPNHQHGNVSIQKGWSSERVPLHRTTSRKHAGSVLPFNHGKTLPSKWEDAERWILSPVSRDSAVRHLFPQPQRGTRSRSGPLGPPGTAYSLYSPPVSMLEGGNVGNLIAGSPFSAGVMGADGLTTRCGGSLGMAGNLPVHTESYMGRSFSVHGCSEMLNQSSLPEAEDEEFDAIRDTATNLGHAVARRDIATQMSPEGSQPSSPRRRPSFSSPSTPSILPIVELQSVHCSKSDIRDVQVDERVTMTRWSKKHRARIPGRSAENVGDWKRKAMDVRSARWEASETAKSISRIQREEARITAWENLQKAKAEAAMRKLEMKLEKKRSSSIDKIMSKLRSAQKKAQEMRSTALAEQAHQVTRTSHKALSFRRTPQISSLSGCFTCHAF